MSNIFADLIDFCQKQRVHRPKSRLNQITAAIACFYFFAEAVRRCCEIRNSELELFNNLSLYYN